YLFCLYLYLYNISTFDLTNPVKWPIITDTVRLHIIENGPQLIDNIDQISGISGLIKGLVLKFNKDWSFCSSSLILFLFLFSFLFSSLFTERVDEIHQFFIFIESIRSFFLFLFLIYGSHVQIFS
ncbi:unnamed protein product, partial [Aphis gossypii]